MNGRSTSGCLSCNCPPSFPIELSGSHVVRGYIYLLTLASQETSLLNNHFCHEQKKTFIRSPGEGEIWKSTFINLSSHSRLICSALWMFVSFHVFHVPLREEHAPLLIINNLIERQHQTRHPETIIQRKRTRRLHYFLRALTRHTAM